MVRNSYNHFHNKKGFTGYRIRPTYLERLNNYLQGVESNHPDHVELEQQEQQNSQHQDYSQAQDNMYDREEKYSTHQNRNTSRNPASNSSSNRINQASVPQSQQYQQQEPPVRRPVSSSDLRNKRTNMMNGTYQSYGSGGRSARRGATYGIKPSYSSGAFQTDGL